MEVRFYRDGDFEEAKRIFVCLAGYYLGESRSSDEEIAENLFNNILGPDSGVKLILALNENGQAVGLSTISLLYPAPKQSSQLFIKELFVLPQWQRKGIGRKIIGFVASYAKTKNCSRMDLTVDLDNPDALRFYSSIGIQELKSKIYLRASGSAISSIAKNM